jgi:hypothetical protein
MAAPLNPVAPLGLDETKLQRLATELAREMYEPADILRMFGVNADEVGELLEASITFQQMYREAYALWHSSGGIKARIETKAQIVIEESIEQLDRDLHDPMHPLSARIETAKFLAGLAKIMQREGQGQVQVGDRVVLNIHFSGNRTVRVAKDITNEGTPRHEMPVEQVIEGSATEVTTVVTP